MEGGPPRGGRRSSHDIEVIGPRVPGKAVVVAVAWAVAAAVVVAVVCGDGVALALAMAVAVAVAVAPHVDPGRRLGGGGRDGGGRQR